MSSVYAEHATRPHSHSPISPVSRRRLYLNKAMRLMQSVYPSQTNHEIFRKSLRNNMRSLELDHAQTQHLVDLLTHGYAFVPAFFSRELIDRIANKSVTIFQNLEAHPRQTSGFQPQCSEFAGHAIELKNPLVHISEILDLAFNEGLLRVVAHFFRQIPATYHVALIRYFPPDKQTDTARLRQEVCNSNSLQIMIDLNDVDGKRGPSIYVPGSNLHVPYRPRLLNALGTPVNYRLLDQADVDLTYPQNDWAKLAGPRGSLAIIHRKGLHSGPSWIRGGDSNNEPRTVVQIDARSPDGRKAWDLQGNIMRKWNFDRMTILQQLFAQASFIEESASSFGAAKASSE